MRSTLRVLGAAALLACGGGDREHAPPPGPPGERDAVLLASAKVALPPPTDPAAIPEPGSEGARLVERYCTACHAVPTPRIHSATDWPRVARRMWLRIDGLPEAFDVPRPTGAERTVMLRYLIGNALRVSGAALPSGEGRTEFLALCGRCHELPDPRAHAPEDWLAVVARMEQRMNSMLGSTLTASQQGAVARYLAAVSAGSPPP